MKRFFLFFILPFAVKAQFAPAVGQPGSTAIHKDSSLIVGWASECVVTRGYQNNSNPSAGTASVGAPINACGPADVTGVVSLGDGGVATVSFQSPVKNGAGPDFCVFENSFDPGFLELAFVEVSSDGVNFTRFPSVCNVQNTVQIGPFDTSNEPSKLNNLAGKYIGGYGVPFDLEELQGISGLDINFVTHVRIIDVIGCIQPQLGSFDSNNNVINDLWPTEFASGGFDLDAVGVINQQPVGIKENTAKKSSGFKIFPSVTQDVFKVQGDLKFFEIEIKDPCGLIVMRGNQDDSAFSLSDYPPGIYFVTVRSQSGSETYKIIRIDR